MSCSDVSNRSEQMIPADLSDFLALAISEQPKSIDLTYMLALQLESEGRLEEARQNYNRCLEINPEHHYARMKLELLGMEEKNQ